MDIDLSKVKLPKKINPSPIIEAIIELRFDSSFPTDAIFGVIYNEFKDDYLSVQELPILQLPELIRKQDPILKYKPCYKLTSKDEKFLFQIGARVISLINLNPYSGWDIFFLKSNNLIQRVEKLDIVSAYTRIGIRYINGFDCNIFEKINLSLNMDGKFLGDLETSIRLAVPTTQFTSTLQIANNAQVTKPGGVAKGSIISIDTYTENPSKDIVDVIVDGHLYGKKLFFALLKEEFIKKELSPEY